MLPMVGLFRLFPCPYFVVGLCERPHCSFRHCRSDVEAARRQSSGNEEIEIDEVDDEEPAEEEKVIPNKPSTSNSTPSSSCQQEKKKATEQKGTSKFEEILKRANDQSNSSSTYKPSKRIKLEEISSSESSIASMGAPIDKECSKSYNQSLSIGGSRNGGTVENEKAKGDRSHSRHSSSHSHSSSRHSSSTHRSHSKHKHDGSNSRHKSSTSKSKESSSRSNDVKSHSNHKSSSESSSKSSSSKYKSASSSSRRERQSNSSTSNNASSEKDQEASKNSDITSNNNNKNNSRVQGERKNDKVDSEDDIELFNTDYPVCVLDSSLVSEDVSKEFLYPSDEESDDESQVALECFQLFQQYENKGGGSEANNKNITKSPNKTEDLIHPPAPTEPFIPGKKRMAHPGAEKASTFDPKVRPTKAYESPTQQLLRRSTSQTVMKPVGENSSLVAHPPVFETPSVAPSITNKRRIAHVSNANALMKPTFNPSSSTSINSAQTQTNIVLGGATRQSTSLSSSSSLSVSGVVKEQQNDPSLTQTISQTAPKGERRLAHQKIIPSGATADRPPLIAMDVSTKVPSAARQKVLDQIYQECLKKHSSSAEASEAAKAEEKLLLARCNSKPVYMSAATNVITRLRRECREGSVTSTGLNSKVGVGNNVVSHHDILVGKSSNISFLNKRASFNPVGSELYAHLTAYLLSNTELVDNGYPRKHPDPSKKGAAVIKLRDDVQPSPSDDPLRKICDRCGINYYISAEDQFPVIKEPCTYHFGRRYTKRRYLGLSLTGQKGTARTGNSEPRFNCCEGDIQSTGCCTAPCHVLAHKSTDNYVSAVLDPGDAGMGTHSWDVVAIDCEMLYTTKGIELARATFVGVDGKILYDSLVKPANPILDYNTRFSGITEDLLKNVSVSLADVQIMVLANLRPNSILIGHSLESDLTALKLIHSCVIDTSVVFPHKLGKPFKRALRNLSAEHLGKIIQNGDAGHDSAEDARTALDLVLHKVKHDHGKGSDKNSKIKGV